MVLTDPQAIFRSYFTPGGGNTRLDFANLTREDGTKAYVTSMYDSVETPLDVLFVTKKFDGIFLISKTIADPVNTPSGPIGIRYTIGIHPVTINKRASSTALSIHAPKLLWQMQQEIFRILRENPVGSMRLAETARIETTRLGVDVFHGNTAEVTYLQYASYY